MTRAEQPPAAPDPPALVRGHIPVLDGLRGAAIALVMLHHFTIIGGATAFDRVFATL